LRVRKRPWAVRAHRSGTAAPERRSMQTGPAERFRGAETAFRAGRRWRRSAARPR
jgi:hypothetical protein